MSNDDPTANAERVMTDDEIRALNKLIAEDHLIATIDVTGKPFHRVMDVTQHTQRRDKLILWLEPAGLDDDLETPMADPDC